jgi:hypothetical protein
MLNRFGNRVILAQANGSGTRYLLFCLHNILRDLYLSLRGAPV